MASPDRPDDPNETVDGPVGPPVARHQLPLERIELPVYVPRRSRPWLPVAIFVLTAVVVALVVWLALR